MPDELKTTISSRERWGLLLDGAVTLVVAAAFAYDFIGIFILDNHREPVVAIAAGVAFLTFLAAVPIGVVGGLIFVAIISIAGAVRGRPIWEKTR